ncbi:MAG: LacI family DNA-binding transcriptional regulator [Alphaproteobacteria bacterium]|nr:LacI family DNA-binding transcriptional regulator [Alphaproteobacteria bacterium]
MADGGAEKRPIRLEDLAELAGVSTATVSRALNDSPLVRDETKRRIWMLARQHRYPFRPQMPAMLSGSSGTITLAIPTPLGRIGGPADPFFMELIGGVGDAAREAKVDVVISHVSPKNFEDLADVIETNRSSGVVFLGQSVLHETFNRLVDTESRFVVWGAELPGQKYCSVGSDNLKGGRRATQHLLRLGRRRIAFFGDADAPEIRQRFSGYEEALREAGVAEDPALVLPTHFEVESAEDAVDRLIDQRAEFDAIFAASDLIALGAVRALRRRGRRVPEDVSIVGYDDVLLARYGNPALTTISQDMSKAGRMLVSKLINSKSGEDIRSERLPTDLIVRESCGA